MAQGVKFFKAAFKRTLGGPSRPGPILCLNLEKCTDWAVGGAKIYFTS